MINARKEVQQFANIRQFPTCCCCQMLLFNMCFVTKLGRAILYDPIEFQKCSTLITHPLELLNTWTLHMLSPCFLFTKKVHKQTLSFPKLNLQTVDALLCYKTYVLLYNLCALNLCLAFYRNTLNGQGSAPPGGHIQ